MREFIKLEKNAVLRRFLLLKLKYHSIFLKIMYCKNLSKSELLKSVPGSHPDLLVYQVLTCIMVNVHWY